ncbi:MAG TPA: T9SS type A sorting domain-containing protein [Ignavibacteriaceae bacterium]|nr:T9SS type A sorting domain-containing protein [Ignavibacteriaceae bacterium]
MIGTDARVLANTGNFRLFVNEPIDIIVAYTAARGTDPVNSITVTRNKVNYALGHYATNFSSVPVSVKDDMVSSPSEFMLSQNYPNPFNPITTIIYSIPNTTLSGVEGSRVQLKIYDVLGKEIATLVNEEKTAGSYEIEFNSHSGEGRNLTSGVYFYTLRAGSFVQTKKMILIK